MKNLAERNKICVFGVVLLYALLCQCLCLLILLSLAFFGGKIDNPFFLLIVLTLSELYVIPKFIRNAKTLTKASKIINKIPQYYLDIFGDNIKIHALDGDYLIKFSDIKRLNYSYDRPILFARFILPHSNDHYELIFSSKIKDSAYALYGNMKNEFRQSTYRKKKTKHGIIFITTKDYFFLLPEIKNVEECFNELKKITNYNSKETNELNNVDEFIDKLYFQISESSPSRNDLTYNEQKFLSLVDLICGSYIPDVDEVIKYLEELGAENYVNIVKETKAEIDRYNPNEKSKQNKFEIQLANSVKILNEEDPFYKAYLLPFAKKHLAEHVKACRNTNSKEETRNK